MATELVRLVTAGSVDDGKSTLIGRLLYDTKQILADQLEHIEETSKRRGDGYVNLALLTDGLRAEREQGITIDVAYRSFVTPRRRFQLADAPGHVQYTRNMVTGASTADVAIILVDARKGVIEQTRRHSYIAAILGTPHVVVAVNKMDLASFFGGALPRDRAGAARDERAARAARRAGDPDVGAARRQRRRARPRGRDSDALVRRADVARAPRDRRDRRRPRPRPPPLPRPVGDPADLRRAPRLPRLRGPGRRRRLAGGRRRRRAPVGPPLVGRVGRDGRRAVGRGRSGHVRHGPAGRRRRRLPRRHARRPGAGARRWRASSRRPSAGWPRSRSSRGRSSRSSTRRARCGRSSTSSSRSSTSTRSRTRPARSGWS